MAACRTHNVVPGVQPALLPDVGLRDDGHAVLPRLVLVPGGQSVVRLSFLPELHAGVHLHPLDPPVPALLHDVLQPDPGRVELLLGVLLAVPVGQVVEELLVLCVQDHSQVAAVVRAVQPSVLPFPRYRGHALAAGGVLGPSGDAAPALERVPAAELPDEGELTGEEDGVLAVVLLFQLRPGFPYAVQEQAQASLLPVGGVQEAAQLGLLLVQAAHQETQLGLLSHGVVQKLAEPDLLLHGLFQEAVQVSFVLIRVAQDAAQVTFLLIAVVEK